MNSKGGKIGDMSELLGSERPADCFGVWVPIMAICVSKIDNICEYIAQRVLANVRISRYKR